METLSLKQLLLIVLENIYDKIFIFMTLKNDDIRVTSKSISL